MATRSGALRALLVAVLATGLAVAAGVTLHSPDTPEVAEPLATRLASIDTGTAVVRRASFCSAVPDADAETAAGGSAEASSWDNGDELGEDVAHEYGCSWTAGSTVASAWVFAPPVTVERARELAASAAKQKGCTPVAGAPAYGSPSVALSCTADGVTTLSYRGLFGDAWLVCQLSGSTDADPAGLADRWCAGVLLAAEAGRVPDATSG